MQSAHLFNEVVTNPPIIFSVGLVIGSVIGFTGVVVLSLVTTGYYYKDIIFTRPVPKPKSWWEYLFT